jgi:uncharacterized protein YfaS (alpha-2-macroglobulin family)
MSKRARLILVGVLSSIAGAAIICGLVGYYSSLPERISDLETIVLGQTQYVPGSEAAMRVIVRDLADQAPIAGAAVLVSMQPQDGGPKIELFEGSTDEEGAADVSFTVPPDLNAAQTLIVETTADLGEDTLEQPVTLDRDYKVLLTTDKPLYQPGQIIHLRALALSSFDRIPASEREIEFTIADGKGNKVFRKTVSTSAYGIAAEDFQLANEVNTGDYKITAQMGNTSSEKTVTVEHYVLPKFEVAWSTDRTFYLPGEFVEGSISAEYFYGKKVDGGEVTITGFTFDFERQDVVQLDGLTDNDGNFTFAFFLPDFIVGTDFEGGAGRFYLEASVTDLAQHTESSSFSIPVSQSSVVIEAIPESGQIRPGVENILYILTSYPDGTPAQTDLDLTINGIQTRTETGRFGLATHRFLAESAWLDVQIFAQDTFGASAEAYFNFQGEWLEETVLLRPDRATYRVGDTMQLEILTNVPSGQVYLDIVRESQTVSTRSIKVNDGRALVGIDLTPDLFGTLELHAYKILSSGIITRDTRLVAVDAPSDLTLAIAPDQEVYRPGDIAGLDFNISGQDGSGAQAALGLAIVDESVFALAQEDPGFAKLYFLLEAELLRPKYDIHGFSVPDLLGDVPDDPALLTAADSAAQASMANAAAFRTPFSLNLNSHDVKIQRAFEIQQTFFAALAIGLFLLEILIALAVAGLMVASVVRAEATGTGITVFLAGVLGLVMIFFLIPIPDWVGSGPLDRLGYMMETLAYGNQFVAAAVLCLAGFGVLGLIALIVYSIIKRDWLVGLALLLTIGFLPVTFGLLFAAVRSGDTPSEAAVLIGAIVLFLVPLAYLFRSAGFSAKLQVGWAIAAFVAAPVALIAVLVPLIASFAFGGSFMSFADGGEADLLRREMVGQDMFAIEEAMPMEMAVEGEMLAAPASTPSPAAGEPPRLRQFFPETMLWLPEAVTDDAGLLSLDVPLADSITTWRLTALASTQDGQLGAATTGIRVFQDFFIDLDLPLALTQNDIISVPVGVFNYLPEAQSVELRIESDDWFELLDEPTKELNIDGNDIQVAFFRIKATGFGRRGLQVTALGSRLSDAIRKEVTVYPDGQETFYSFSDRLPTEGISQSVEIPGAAITGTQRLTVKIYPGIVSQVVEGLDSILRMPFGCFEQTSSTTYPNVLSLDYLQTTGQTSPEVELKAEEYINLGYQRLTTFEVGGGGFSLFGDAPADRMLTAYGLQEFTDMSVVHNVDPDLVSRAAEWLLGQQSTNGSWENDQGLVHESTWQSLPDPTLPVTSYVVWSLIEAGFYDDARVQAGLDYIKENRSSADDAYVLALVANALAAAALEEGSLDNFAEDVMEALAGMAQFDGEAAFWSSSVATFTGADGQTGSIETTGLAAFALLRADRHPEVANAALTYIIRQKDSFGTWYSTQATVLSLKSLLESVKAGADDVDAEVTVRLNGSQERKLQVTKENFDVVQLLSFDDVRPGASNVVDIQVSGQGELMYQISGSYFLPWQDVISLQGPDYVEPVSIDVSYDRTELQVDETVEVTVDVTLNEAGRAEWALIDLGIPPGFSVRTEDLTALVNRYQDVPEDYEFPTIERFEMTGRQVLVYIGGLSFDHPLTFTYRLQAKYPLVAQTPASTVYDYYNPNVSGVEQPVVLMVVGDTP